MQLSKETINALKHAGAHAFPFSKLALALELMKRDKQYSELEREFYDEESEVYAIYHQTAVQYEMKLQGLLFTAVSATTKDSKTFDRAAYEELKQIISDNKEEYEREKREYLSR